MVDLAGLDSQFGGIHARIADASAATAAAEIGEVLAATERAGLRGDPVADAIAMLHVAHWQVARRDDNQFAVSQESVFRRMRAFLSAAEWEQVGGLAAEEFRAALARAPDAVPGGEEVNGACVVSGSSRNATCTRR